MDNKKNIIIGVLGLLVIGLGIALLMAMQNSSDSPSQKKITKDAMDRSVAEVDAMNDAQVLDPSDIVAELIDNVDGEEQSLSDGLAETEFVEGDENQLQEFRETPYEKDLR